MVVNVGLGFPFMYYVLLLLAICILGIFGKGLAKDDTSFIIPNDVQDGIIRIPLKRLSQQVISEEVNTKFKDKSIARPSLWESFTSFMRPSHKDTIPGPDSVPYPGYPGPYPGSYPGPYLGHPGPYPGHPGPYPAHPVHPAPYPGHHAPYPGPYHAPYFSPYAYPHPYHKQLLSPQPAGTTTVKELLRNLGLGLQNQSLTPQDLYEQNQIIGRNMVSLYLPRITSDLTDTKGELVIGGADPKYFTGDFTFVPMIQNQSWLFDLDSFGVEGNPASFMPINATAFLDTGKSFIQLATRYLDPLNLALGGEFDPSIKNYVFDCNHLSDGTYKTLQIGIGGTLFDLTPDMYTQPRGTNGCVSGIEGGAAHEGTRYILGQYFLENFYTLFDFENSRFGIAQLNPDLN